MLGIPLGKNPTGASFLRFGRCVGAGIMTRMVEERAGTIAENDAGEDRKGHAVHFLKRLSRVSLGQTELALRLYRDPRLVREVLADRLLPTDTPRVAIAIEPGPAPAHVVVQRSGAFVTCLAPGMGTAGMAVLPYERLTLHLARADRFDEEARRGMSVLEREAHTRHLFERLFHAGPGLTREEFRELEAIEPFMRTAYRTSLVDFAGLIEEKASRMARLHRGRRWEEVALRSYWDAFHAAGHLTLLTAVGGRPSLLDWGLAIEQATGHTGRDPAFVICEGIYLGLLIPSRRSMALRVMWALARGGSLVVPWLERSIQSKIAPRTWYALVAALAAVGCAHHKLRAEVERFICALGAPPMVAACDAPVILERVKVVTGVFDAFRALGPEGARASWRTIAHVFLRPGTEWEAVDTPEENREGSASDLMAAEYLNEARDTIDAGAGKSGIMQGVPFVGIAPAEAFCFPAAEADRRAPQFTPEVALELARWAAPPPPVHVGKKAGRNDPCPCGSGKKVKHCCG